MEQATRARATVVVACAVALVLVAVGILLLTRDDDGTTTPAPAPTTPTTPAPDQSSGPPPTPTAPSSGTQPVKVGVYGDPGTWWAGNGITNVYLTAQENAEAFPVGRLQALLKRGTSLNLTITTRGTDYLVGIADGDPTATAWLTAYVRQVGRVAAFAQRLGNGTYVVATVFHESTAQVAKAHVTGESTDFVTIGRAQQIAIELGHRLAPDAQWSVWLVGHDRVDESRQLAQITDPKPDLISLDPYANRDCVSTLADIAEEDLVWVRRQPAYDGRLAISETGMNSECPDQYLAAFYTDIAGQLRGLGPDLQFYVMFNSDNGTFPHDVSTGTRPLAQAALRASLTRS